MARKTKADEQLLKEVRDNLRIAIDAEDDNRSASLEDLRFENGDQWLDGDRKDRENDGRPCLTINKAAGSVRLLVGEQRQANISIKVRPVDDESDVPVAEVLNGIIRNIENISNAESAYDYAFECAIRGGFGYFRVATDYASDDSFDQDILIKRIVNPYSVYYDPTSVELDMSDAGWCLVTETLSIDEFKRKYPKNKTVSAIEEGDGEEDASWFTEDEIRIAEYFKVEKQPKKIYLTEVGKIIDGSKVEQEDIQRLKDSGQITKERTVYDRKITWFKTTGHEILEGPKEWAGQYIPIVPVWGEELWIEGRKVLRSAVKWLKEPARLYNWARSNAAEMLALAPKQPFILTPQEIEGHEAQWEIANRKPMPYLLHNPSNLGRPQRQSPSIADSGAIQEAMMANDDIKATSGYHDPSLGAQSNETSGRAILARQRQTNTSTFVFTDNLTRAMKHCGKVLVDLIPRIYDTERVVRLLNQDGSEGWALINKEDPNTGDKELDLSVGKYDVTIDVGAQYATKRLEAADNMVQLLTAAPNYAPIIMPRIAKNLDWPESDEIAEEMMQMNQPQGPSPEDQMQMQKGQLDMEGKTLDNTKKKIDIAKEDQQQMVQTAQVAASMVLEALRPRQ